MLRREREQALLVEKSKQEEKERRKLEQQLAKEAKEAKKKASKEKKVKDSGCLIDVYLFFCILEC
jgi:hypothetical protein